MATLTSVFEEIQRRVSVYLGYGRGVPVAASSKELDINDAIRSGLRRFYHCGYPWKFLTPIEWITTGTPYATGTVEIVPGVGGSVVTLTGGTWPTAVGYGWRIRVGGDAYDVIIRSSGTELRILDPEITVAAGSAFSIGQPYYSLPADFAAFAGKMQLTYQPGTGNLYGPIPIVDEVQLRALEEDFDWSYRPLKAALRPKTLDAENESQIWQLQLWPVPDARYRLAYRYEHNPEMLDDTNVNHWGGTPHSEAIIAACLAAAEEMLNDGQTLMEQRFQAKLAISIEYDRKRNAPDRLGPWYDNSTLPYELPTREELLVDYRMTVPVVEGS